MYVYKSQVLRPQYTQQEAKECEAALLVDATNAFNALNRQVALQNIRHLCPSISTILINLYRSPVYLFVDGDVILSQEGTTQGDPLAMPMYGLEGTSKLTADHRATHRSYF